MYIGLLATLGKIVSSTAWQMYDALYSYQFVN